MENWEEPELKEIIFSDTQYGGKVVSTYDNIYQNDENVWEATVVRTPES